MPFPLIPLIGTGISALAGLFGNRGNRTPSEQTNTTTSSGSSTNSGTNMGFQNFELSPLQSSLLNTAGYGALDRFKRGPSDVSGIIANQINNVNAGANAIRENTSRNIASRGQSFSPAASFTETMNEINKQSQINDVVNTEPLLKRQIDMENLDNIMKAFSLGPINSSNLNTFSGSNTTNNSSTQRGTGLITQPGNMTGGLLSGLGAGLFTPIDGSGRTILDVLFGGGGGNVGNT